MWYKELLKESRDVARSRFDEAVESYQSYKPTDLISKGDIYEAIHNSYELPDDTEYDGQYDEYYREAKRLGKKSITWWGGVDWSGAFSKRASLYLKIKLTFDEYFKEQDYKGVSLMFGDSKLFTIPSSNFTFTEPIISPYWGQIKVKPKSDMFPSTQLRNFKVKYVTIIDPVLAQSITQRNGGPFYFKEDHQFVLLDGWYSRYPLET